MMTTAKMAETAYGAQSAAARTPRGTEYAVFSQVTRRMKAAAEKGRAGFPALAEALHDNRRLWTTLAVNVADGDNGLPRDLRARLVYLAEFTFQHSSKVLAREADVRPLIEINAAVMRGLLGQPPAQPAETAEPATRPEVVR
ncbi:flagellar biosynthesis regulator FlaF [Rhodovulum sp. 12E13]|uniref:flagellar biosynthesis regulator FlaF n=1 Tax=Rhodovulum sp. 12E13 TaxID=2203891 RepID=UPI002684A4FC